MRQAFCGKGIEMIIWAASFPRSGNTFCRVAMHRLYGLSTYVGVGSGEDLATYGAEELVGLRPPPPKLAAALRHAPVDYGNEVFTPGPELLDALEEMDRSDEIFVLKTHRAIRFPGRRQRTILLVRDGRDVYCSLAKHAIDVKTTWKSWASFSSQNFPWRGLSKMARPSVVLQKELYILRWTLFASVLRAIGMQERLYSISMKRWVREAGWRTWHASYLEVDPEFERTALVMFDDLVRDPVNALQWAMHKLDVPLVCRDERVADFKELKQRAPQFFRAGTSGQWKAVFSRALMDEFWHTHLPMMQRFGFADDAAGVQAAAPRV